MLTITHSHVWVFDLDEAIDFYVGTLGFEIATDVDLEFMRWVTVQAPGQPERQVLLELTAPPSLDPGSAETVRDLVSKGATGFALGLTTDDCRGTYEALRAKGVEFVEEPTERFYGIDCAIRDPFGNQIRITEPAPPPAAGG